MQALDDTEQPHIAQHIQQQQQQHEQLKNEMISLHNQNQAARY
jgi:hypothetical protein